MPRCSITVSGDTVTLAFITGQIMRTPPMQMETMYTGKHDINDGSATGSEITYQVTVTDDPPKPWCQRRM